MMMDEVGTQEKMEEVVEEIESEELRSERQQRILNVRKEKSRDAARNRRSKENTQYEELAKLLPFPPSVTSQLDKASIIRLTISYLKYQELLGNVNKGTVNQLQASFELPSSLCGEDVGAYLLQALDGFIFCISQEGKVIYISETVTTHLGLSQLDLIGTSIFNIIHPDDQKTFSEIINRNIPNPFPMLQYQYDDYDVMCSNEAQYNIPITEESVSTFTRMKCALIKRSGCYVKSSGYKVIHVTGKLIPYRNFDRNTYFSRVLVATGQPLPPPTICELKIDTKVYVSRCTMDLKIVFCEGRIHKYLDFLAKDIVGESAYNFYLGGDGQKIVKSHVDCLRGGKCVTAAYRWINKYGGFVWTQTVGTVIKRHGPHGEESQILCVNYVSSEPLQENTVVHDMQEKFNRMKLEEKKTSESNESYDDFGLDTKHHTKISSHDIISSIEQKSAEQELENSFTLPHVPPPAVNDLPQPTQPTTIDALADIGIPFTDRIPSLQDTIAQEEADRILADVMKTSYGVNNFNSHDPLNMLADMSTAQQPHPIQPPYPSEYSCSTSNFSTPRYKPTNQYPSTATMNHTGHPYVSNHLSGGGGAVSYEKNYPTTNNPTTNNGNPTMQHNVYISNVNPNNMYRHSNQLPPSQILSSNNNNNNSNNNHNNHSWNNSMDGGIVNIKHELPSPPHRQMYSNWNGNVAATTTGAANVTAAAAAAKRVDNMFLHHPMLPNGNKMENNNIPMDLNSSTNSLYGSENNNNNNNYPATTSGLEGLPLMKQLEYNHNGYLNDVPFDPHVYGFGGQMMPSYQRDYP